MQFPIFYSFIAPDIDGKVPLAAMKAAIDLSGQLNAQLSVAIGALQVSVPNLWNSATIGDLIARENKRSEESAGAAEDQIVALAVGTSTTIHTEILKGELGQLKTRFAARARNHGLVIAEKGKPGEILGSTLIEPLLFQSGRPVMIIPNGLAADLSLTHVLISWDGSASAARAVWDSVPLLQLATSIEIVTVVGEKDFEDVPAANALAGKLSYLGKKLNVSILTHDGASVAGNIQRHARQIGAGLIVQGAYGRSRWSEFILGGVTREMLQDGTLPVLMSH